MTYAVSFAVPRMPRRAILLTEGPPLPALRATFSRGGEKGSRLPESAAFHGLLPSAEKVPEGRMRGACSRHGVAGRRGNGGGVMPTEAITFESLAPVYPELLVAAGALVLLLAGVLFRRERHGLVSGAAIVLLVAAGILVVGAPDGVLFTGGFISDAFARYMKVLVIGGSALALVLSYSSAEHNGLNKFEYSVLVVLATLGMMAMVSANDLMTLYVGLELQSLALYVVAAMRRDDARASEAGLKYFVLGALSSGMLLYSTSLVYGFTGTTRLDQIVAMIVAEERSIGLVFGMVFLLAGVAFKISAVPFHMWTPDVYEGAPTPVTAFFASAPKVAAMALFIRIVTVSFEPVTADWQQIVIFSIASMILAAFAAIGRTTSSGAGLFLHRPCRLRARRAVVGDGGGGRGRRHLHGDLHRHDGRHLRVPALAQDRDGVRRADRRDGGAGAAPAVRGGVDGDHPVLADRAAAARRFFAKWHVFLAAIEAQLFVLAVIGVLASAVSAFYYLHHQGDVFRRAGGRVRRRAARAHLVTAAAVFLVVTYYVTVGAPLATAAHTAAEACSSARLRARGAAAAGAIASSGSMRSARPARRRRTRRGPGTSAKSGRGAAGRPPDAGGAAGSGRRRTATSPPAC